MAYHVPDPKVLMNPKWLTKKNKQVKKKKRNPIQTSIREKINQKQKKTVVFMFSKHQAPFLKGKLRTDQLFSRCHPLLPKHQCFNHQNVSKIQTLFPNTK